MEFSSFHLTQEIISNFPSSKDLTVTSSSARFLNTRYSGKLHRLYSLFPSVVTEIRRDHGKNMSADSILTINSNHSRISTPLPDDRPICKEDPRNRQQENRQEAEEASCPTYSQVFIH